MERDPLVNEELFPELAAEEEVRTVGSIPQAGGRRVRLLGVADLEMLSRATGFAGSPERVTQQQFAQDADAATIVKRFQGFGQLPPPRLDGVYGDFTDVMDYESAVERLERAERSFMQIDPAIREQFGNDPSRFLDWAVTRTPEELMVDLGYPAEAAHPPEPAAPQPIPVPIPPPAPPAEPVVAPVSGGPPPRS